ncbi:Tat proofreading chaperone DmsD [Curtanaerobium respiraculi]|uniref:Tat proofreading chaperone DmsD n=1 Tax=Curtanaerobium respiraculi TaxID=2949669 RepID=UPI0024B3B2A8|nr:Tat proofreading chaperone DmsD [Curtanaerobium respiraculi]
MDDRPIEPLAFTGETLGPLFAYDPAAEEVAALLGAFAGIDADAAAVAWPFGVEDDVRAALRIMKDGLSAWPDKTALAREYRRLFVGPGRKACPPWGSVYTDRDGVIFGATALDLHDWLGEHGIARSQRDRMPDDHIGTMLELLAWIARNNPELVGEYLSKHLLTWAPHFLEKMEVAARHPFYRGLSQLTFASLDGVRTTWALEVPKLRFYR